MDVERTAGTESQGEGIVRLVFEGGPGGGFFEILVEPLGVLLHGLDIYPPLAEQCFFRGRFFRGRAAEEEPAADAAQAAATEECDHARAGADPEECLVLRCGVHWGWRRRTRRQRRFRYSSPTLMLPWGSPPGSRCTILMWLLSTKVTSSLVVLSGLLLSRVSMVTVLPEELSAFHLPLMFRPPLPPREMSTLPSDLNSICKSLRKARANSPFCLSFSGRFFWKASASNCHLPTSFFSGLPRRKRNHAPTPPPRQHRPRSATPATALTMRSVLLPPF